MNEDELKGLAEALGIAPGFHDISGTWNDVRPEVLERLIAAFGPGPTPEGEAPPDPGLTPPAFLPPAIAEGKRIWGIAAQLYGLTSGRNWGIGDFTDLDQLIALAADAGADAVMLNPLHALFTCYPDHVSPYAPSSRLALNPLYIDVEAIPDFAECTAVREKAAEPAFRQALARLRAAPLVDYEGVSACKLPVLRKLFDHFRSHHLDRDTVRGRDFLAFRAEGGDALRTFAVFEALSAHFRATHEGGWHRWPLPYRDPATPEVRRFAEDHPNDILFALYLQWIADGQLCAAAERAKARGMQVGIVADIAIGCDAAGADAWSDPDLIALDAEIGAPPDPFCADGQSWGAPPWRPNVLMARGMAPLRILLDRTMRWAGGVRLDHVIGFERQFWVPRGLTGRDGAYVAYPREEMFAAAAKVSRQYDCLVIGEDLGTVPEGFRDRMAAWHMLSTRVMRFERGWDGGFKPPVAYPRLSCACAGTHDLAPVQGFVHGADIRARAAIDGTGEEDLGVQLAHRAEEVAALCAALAQEDLLEYGTEPDAARLTAGVHAFVARTGSALAFAQMEDILGLAEQANLPGTVAGHPNWRRKYPVTLDALAEGNRLAATGSIFREAGRL